MKRVIWLMALAACGQRETARDTTLQGSASFERQELAWHGDRWTGDYFDLEDRLVWAEKEGVYLVGQQVGAVADGYGSFTVHGRASDEPHQVRSKDYYGTHPATPEDLRWGRWCFISETVRTSPKHMIELKGPNRDFVLKARREDWHRFFINNTSGLVNGRIDVLINGETHVIPTWAIRVAGLKP